MRFPPITYWPNGDINADGKDFRSERTSDGTISAEDQAETHLAGRWTGAQIDKGFTMAQDLRNARKEKR